MDKIYDNGQVMLGNVKMIKEEIKKQLKNGVDMFCTDMEEILNDLKQFSNETIVSINYDFGMGYMIDYWNEDDIIKEG